MSEKFDSESSMLKENTAITAVIQENINQTNGDNKKLISNEQTEEKNIQDDLNTIKESYNLNKSNQAVHEESIPKDEKLHDKCHVFTTKIDNDLKCSLCLKSFKNKRKLKTHLYLCHCVIENIVSLQDNLFPTQEPVHSTSESDSEIYDFISNGNINNSVCVAEISDKQSDSMNIIKNNNFNWKNKRINNFFADALRELEVANTLIDLQVLNSHKQVMENGIDENKNKNLLQLLNLSDTNCLNKKTNFHNGSILQKVIANKNTLTSNSEENSMSKNEAKKFVNMVETKSESEINNFEVSDFNKCNEIDMNITDKDEINSSNSENLENKGDTIIENKECETISKSNLISNCLNPTLNSLPLFPYINFPLINSLSNGNFPLQELSHLKNNIRIDDETVLVTKLEGIHPTTKQSYVLYKCCLCGNVFSALDTLHNHVGGHGNNKEKNCGKCGAIFKCDGQLEIHNQLHQAIETNSLLSLTPGLFLTPFGTLCSQVDNQINQETPSVSGFNKLDPYWSMIQQIYAGYSGNIYPFLTVGNLPFFGNSQHSLINEIINNNTSAKSPVENLNKVPINKPVYKCSFCPKIFDRVFSLQRHERVHTGIKPCSCKICGRGFSEKRNLRHHVIRFHSDSNRKELLWRAHRQKSRLKSAHGPKKLVSFLKRAATCILNSMGQNKLDCNEDSSPDSASELKASETLQSSFSTVFDEHKNSETSIKLSKDKQNDTFEENRQFKINMLSQNNNLTSNLFNKSNYQEITQDGNLEKLFMERTNKEDTNISDKFKSEQMDIQNTKEECVATFNPRSDTVNSTSNKNHMIMASTQGNYSYICNYCSKTFCSTSDLKRHMDFHKNIRPYKCPSCEYRSRTNSQLKVHMMRHQGIRQYLCHPCNYGGVTQSDLNRHLKTRTHILRTRTICSS
ncbi:sal-like protein 1 [Centruroides sculpturatus]|uniref:sal-like protein 1 n=1 Tax=Centruroides sculpturatus TaxID=218467 RepID=UPI000C6EFCE5|nr:sal-like protein 1 [Centruroides sculpturatus]XP_023216352.1 sal-like protein 1 [Centruroides sculpturatus]XP_023216353.1 sal-like protein 1 [Centruroides sculpturatus]